MYSLNIYNKIKLDGDVDTILQNDRYTLKT